MQQAAVFTALCLALALVLGPCAAVSRVKACSEPGAVVCDDTCENLVVCLGDGAGFRGEPVETCDATAGTHCYAPNQRCDKRNSCDESWVFPFECTTSGQLPNPVDCTKFFVCAPGDTEELVAFQQSCNEGYAYNSSHGFCNLPLSHPTCLNGPVPPCTQVGAIGSLPENNSIYYVCKRRGEDLVPVLFVCKNGGTFDDDTATCIPSTRTSEDFDVDPPMKH